MVIGENQHSLILCLSLDGSHRVPGRVQILESPLNVSMFHLQVNSKHSVGIGGVISKGLRVGVGVKLVSTAIYKKCRVMLWFSHQHIGPD